MNELEQAIYDSLIEIILKGFTEEEQEEVKTEYQNYLIQYYRDLYNLDKDKEKLKKHFIKMEILKWQNKAKDFIQRSLLKDDYFAKIYEISQMAYRYANLRLTGSKDQIDITKEEIDEKIRLMNEYLEKVRPFNKQVAIEYLSEGSTDFYYALGLIEETSFRLH